MNKRRVVPAGAQLPPRPVSPREQRTHTHIPSCSPDPHCLPRGYMNSAIVAAELSPWHLGSEALSHSDPVSAPEGLPGTCCPG